MDETSHVDGPQRALQRHVRPDSQQYVEAQQRGARQQGDLAKPDRTHLGIGNQREPGTDPPQQCDHRHLPPGPRRTASASTDPDPRPPRWIQPLGVECSEAPRWAPGTPQGWDYDRSRGRATMGRPSSRPASSAPSASVKTKAAQKMRWVAVAIEMTSSCDPMPSKLRSRGPTQPRPCRGRHRASGSAPRGRPRRQLHERSRQRSCRSRSRQSPERAPQP